MRKEDIELALAFMPNNRAMIMPRGMGKVEIMNKRDNIIIQSLRNELHKAENYSLSPQGIKGFINKPIFVTVDNKGWWDIVKAVRYTDVAEENINCCYIHLAIFGNAHYNTFEFYEFEKE